MISLCWLLCQCWGAAVEPNAPVSPMVPVLRYEFSTKDDIDRDGDPDDWVRRKGVGFPRYVGIKIDPTVGHNDHASLRFQANGGAAALYSPPTRVDGLHTYYLEGWVKADGLKHDAAMISISFLNHRRERIERRLSPPVLDTRGEWVCVRIGPLTPDPSVHFVVIGCHLAPDGGDVRDIQANAWFDNLLLGKMPRLDLDRSFTTHFLSTESPLRLTSRVSGLDAHHDYILEYFLRDATGKILAQSAHPLEADLESTSESANALPSVARVVAWDLSRQVPGFYQVEAQLQRDRQLVAKQKTTVAVVEMVQNSRTSGEFGWSFTQELPGPQRLELPNVAAQAGINWVKYPLWQVARMDAPQEAGEVATMFDRLAAMGVRSVGVLHEPPPAIRAKFARNWQGVSEVFTLPADFWRSSLEPVVARFSSNVHDWQLGNDDDTSFRGLSTLPDTVGTVRKEIQRISMIARVGIPWQAGEPIPATVPVSFLSLVRHGDATANVEPLLTPLRRTTSWETIHLSQLPGDDVTTRAGALARTLIAAKVRQAPAIFATDIFHPRSGLLEPNGAPAELFLAWRTATLAMQNAEYIGKFVLPKRTQNAVFVRDGEAIVAVWNETPVTESLYFGDQPYVLDLWGRRLTLPTDPKTGEQSVEIGPLPIFIRGGLESVARWRIMVQFEKGQMKSEYGDHQDAIVGSNTFKQGVSGSVNLVLPHEWESNVREWPVQLGVGESFRLPFNITLPSNARLGEQMAFLDFNLVSDRPRRFRVYHPYQVGTGDISIEVVDRLLPDGGLEIEQIVVNRTSPPETLDFRCTLYVPGERRQRLNITKLGNGEDRKFYRLPNAERIRSEPLTLRLEQLGGRRIINYQWTIKPTATTKDELSNASPPVTRNSP